MNRIFDPGWETERPVLVCLDLQQPVDGELASWTGSRQSDPGARLLAHARRNGWSVVHVYRDGARGRGESPASPLPGFEPRPSEPVFLRRGVSAFTSARFAEVLDSALEAEVLVAGGELGSSVLATVLDAHDRGLSVTLVQDAFGASPVRGVEPDVLEQVLLELLAPFARLSRVDAVLAEPRREPTTFANDD